MANPLCALIGRVKTGFMASDVRTDLKQLYVAVEGHIASYGEKLSNWTNSSTIQDKNYLPAIPNIEKWF